MKQYQDKQQLPPKTCTIERLITMDKDVLKVLSGTKTATRRNGRYADINEIMKLDGQEFIVRKVYSQTLGEMTDKDAKQEGFENLDAYKDSILSIHPGMKWAPKLQVWVHEFEPLQNSAQ